MVKHEFSKLDAHEAACQAPRGDIQYETYYNPVNDDDTIFDLIEEMDQEQYAEQYKETLSNFDVTDFNNNRVVAGTSDIPNEKESSEMVNVVDVQIVDNSNQVVSCKTAYSGITECNNSDQEVESAAMLRTSMMVLSLLLIVMKCLICLIISLMQMTVF